MRKIVSLVLAILFMTISSAVPAAFAESNKRLSEEEVHLLVAEANGKIDSLIENAVEDSEKLESRYVKEKQKTQERIVQVQSVITSLAIELQDENDDEKLLKKMENAEEKLLKENENLEKLQNKFNEKLDRLIQNLLDVTNEISADTISKAAESGITVECTWVLVEFGGKKVWVDPLKVVGP
ncbi:hypothetical protein [Metabacillus idriensis]|uniref:hypothetical protein n=1 Tax=Metabacillus idriensis TaxID=324768 RepID=UPI003D2CF705